ncbi:UDP-glucose dehydrogenase family protein [bacterium]
MKICVVGTGYVGLVTGICLAQVGHKVMCIDTNIEKVKMLNKGKSPIYEPKLDRLLKKNIKEKSLFFRTHIKDGLDFSDVIFVAVGTPSKNSGEADLSSVEKVCIRIAEFMTKYKVIVSKSTVPVETGQKIVDTINLYNKKNIKFDVVSNPEFLREGSAVYDFMHPDRIVIGVNTDRAKKIMKEVYKKIKALIIFTDVASAELIKHASNSFLSMKISYINALSQICEKTGADVRKVAEGMGFDKRIGRDFLDAGIGFGGSCFPKDLSAFISIAKEEGYNFELLKVVRKINEDQKKYFVKKLKEVLWNFNDKVISVLGLSFKPNTDDMRQAPSIDIINMLLKEGAIIKVYDPAAMDNAKKIFGSHVIYGKNPYDIMKKSNALLILTDWQEFLNLDFGKIKKLLYNPVIFDGRNCLNIEKMRKLGFVYRGVGC